MKNKPLSPDNSLPFKATLRFHGNLRSLLSPALTGNKAIEHTLKRRASIKDVVESLGVPHTEIDKIETNDTEVSFSYIVQHSDHINIFPPIPPVDVFTPTLLRPYALEDIRFTVDTNVGKLASLLRMAGFDTSYKNLIEDKELADISHNEKRILLTRDRKLLNRKNIVYGHLIRECNPLQQLKEVLLLYGLKDRANPFSRCMRCNGLLESVSKDNIIHRLKPLTKKYYNTFQRCTQCEKLYWAGSHRKKMENMLRKIIPKEK